METPNQRPLRRSRTVIVLAQLIGGFLLGFSVTVTFTQLPTISVDGQMALLDQ